jgi:hypothetical protein
MEDGGTVVIGDGAVAAGDIGAMVGVEDSMVVTGAGFGETLSNRVPLDIQLGLCSALRLLRAKNRRTDASTYFEMCCALP